MTSAPRQKIVPHLWYAREAEEAAAKLAAEAAAAEAAKAAEEADVARKKAQPTITTSTAYAWRNGFGSTPTRSASPTRSATRKIP